MNLSLLFDVLFISVMKNIIVGNNRLRRERITIEKMIYFYCCKIHIRQTGLCDDCRHLLDYSLQRLINCPFEEEKPVCSACTVHCYKPDIREKVKTVMRFSGPRMLLRHPYLAIMHLLDEKLYKPLILR
jgi:hypothetical protein